MEKPKILYVDDEPINLMLFQANLEEQYTIITAEDGEQGLEILKLSSNIKAVFSDMRMPKMNGVEFIKQAKSLLPISTYYIITGFDFNDDIQEAINAQLISKCFKKPIKLNEIISELNSIFYKS